MYMKSWKSLFERTKKPHHMTLTDVTGMAVQSMSDDRNACFKEQY